MEPASKAVQAEATREWLKPSEALARFVPPPNVDQHSPIEGEHRLRYGFRVSDLGFLVASGTASEVIRPLPVYPIPNTPNWLQGLVNLRGNLIPVFDLARLMGLSDSAREEPMLLVLDQAEWAVGLPIDGLPRPLHAEQQVSQLPALPANLKEHITAGYVVGGHLWLEFKHRTLLQTCIAQALGAQEIPEDPANRADPSP